MDTETLLQSIASLASRRRQNAPWSKVWIYKRDCLVFEFQVYEHRYALDMLLKGESLELSVTARAEDGRRILRNTLVGEFPMIRREGERHLLWTLDSLTPQEVLAEAEYWHARIAGLIRGLLQASSQRDGALPESVQSLFWWDDRPNFGDAIGPWLVRKISGRTPLNARGRHLASPPTAVVGSIAGWIEQDGTRIWGSGLMNPLTQEDTKRLRGVRGVKVYAVRGEKTRDELVSKLGWDVPEIFGDPALLLPQFLPISKMKNTLAPISVVPHLNHAKYFTKINDESVRVIDVQNGLERVVEDIATSSACISTSLHGIIIAQAYGVPWVWLQISDHPLGGGSFKFEDFFTALDRGAVISDTALTNEITGQMVYGLADRSALPDMRISLEPLLDSFCFALEGGSLPATTLITV